MITLTRGFLHVSGAVIQREHHHLRRMRHGAEALCHFNSAGTAHAHAHQHHIGKLMLSE